MAGFGIAIIGTMVAALWTGRLPRLLPRIVVTILAALFISCVVVWLSSWFSSSDEAESWGGFIIAIYFVVGAFFGVWVLMIMQIVKKVGAKKNAH
jgi:hypothetical protein